jgi:hypothetical protein
MASHPRRSRSDYLYLSKLNSRSEVQMNFSPNSLFKTNSPKVRGGGRPTQLGPLERANLNHWTAPESESYVTIDGQLAICLVIKYIAQAYDQISVVYNCCWLLPVQSFSGPSPMVLPQIQDFPLCQLLQLTKLQ